MVPSKLYPTNYPNGLSTAGEPNQGLIGNFSTIVTLTAAQILAFNNNINTSVLLIPTLPVENQSLVGNVIILKNVFVEITSNGTAYANGSNLIFHYGSGVANFLSQISAANMLLLIGQTVPCFGPAPLANTNNLQNALTVCANQGLYANVAGAQFTAGTSPVKFYLDYSVIAL